MTPNTVPLILAIFTLVYALSVAGGVPAAISQEDSGPDEQLAGGLISKVLDGDDETDQDSTNIGIVNQHHGETLDQDNNSIPVNEEELATPNPAPTDSLQSLSIRFVEEPSLRLDQPFDERGLATSASITASGTIIGSEGTMTLTSETNVFSMCEDDETGELSNTQKVQSTISSNPVIIEIGRQSFEITTYPITEPIGDGGCEEGQTAILNFVQFIEPVLTIKTEGGNTATHTFPTVS